MYSDRRGRCCSCCSADILGHRHPDVFTVVVHPAWVILRAVGKLDFTEQVAGGIELEQPATAGACRTIDREIIQRVGNRAVAHGALQYLYGRHVERLTYLDKTLGVKGLPVHCNGTDARPDRVFSHETKQVRRLVVARAWPQLLGESPRVVPHAAHFLTRRLNDVTAQQQAEHENSSGFHDASSRGRTVSSVRCGIDSSTVTSLHFLCIWKKSFVWYLVAVSAPGTRDDMATLPSNPEVPLGPSTRLPAAFHSALVLDPRRTHDTYGCWWSTSRRDVAAAFFSPSRRSCVQLWIAAGFSIAACCPSLSARLRGRTFRPLRLRRRSR